MKINKKVIVRICLIWGIIGLIILVIWFSQVIPSPEETTKRIIYSYLNENYSGLVVNKFIDREEHNFKKVVLQENNLERVILFDGELGNIFEFIRKGDSIVKTRGNLRVHLIREDLDTVLNIKLYGMEKYNMDSILNEYKYSSKNKFIYPVN